MKTFTLGIRETPCGAVAWMQPPSGGVREKRFRNGYAAAKHSAQKQIDEWIAVIREGAEIDGGPAYEIVETHKSGRGGTRQGAGRKPAPDGTVKVPMTIKVEPECQMKNHGGKRPGAGRKPAPEGTKKIAYGTKLDPQVVEYLRSRSNAAETIENAIKRSKDWRDWTRSRGTHGKFTCQLLNG